MDRILIVDDDPENILLARMALERAGFEVEATTDPRQAMPMAAGGEFDAVVLDLVMPGLSGIEVLWSMRADPRTRSLPILFLSSLAEVGDRIRGLQEGADDYLGKPFHPEELVLRLERLVAAIPAQNGGLEGRLEDFLIADVMQAVSHDGKSGLVLITGDEGSGRLVLHEGSVLSASHGRLAGRDALLAILGLRSGRFRFTLHPTTRGTPPAGDGPLLSLQAAIREAAWLEEETARRRAFLPPLSAPLEAGALERAAPPLEGLSPGLAERLHGRVAANPGLRLADLLAEQLAAPAEVRLATAWLIEQGGLAPRAAPRDNRP